MACSTAWGSPSKPVEGTHHQNVSDCPQSLGQQCQERAELSARHRTRGRHTRLQTQEGNGTGPDQEVLLPHHTLRSACRVWLQDAHQHQENEPQYQDAMTPRALRGTGCIFNSGFSCWSPRPHDPEGRGSAGASVSFLRAISLASKGWCQGNGGHSS